MQVWSDSTLGINCFLSAFYDSAGCWGCSGGQINDHRFTLVVADVVRNCVRPQTRTARRGCCGQWWASALSLVAEAVVVVTNDHSEDTSLWCLRFDVLLHQCSSQPNAKHIQPTWPPCWSLPTTPQREQYKTLDNLLLNGHDHLMKLRAGITIKIDLGQMGWGELVQLFSCNWSQLPGQWRALITPSGWPARSPGSNLP